MASYTVLLGKDKFLQHRFTNEGGSAYNLTGATVYWRLKADRNDADADAVLTKSWIASVESGLSLTDPETGVAVLASAGVLYNRITIAQVAALNPNVTYAYDLELTDTLGIERLLDSGTLTVSSGAEGAESSSGTLNQSLSQLRQRVARRLGDYIGLIATSNGTTTTFIDTTRINTATEDMKGRALVLMDGSLHFVTAQVDSTGTLTFTPAASAATLTEAADTASVYNKRGKGFLPADYDAAINDAINDAFPLGMIEVESVVSGTFDAESPDITVPFNMYEVHTIQWQDSDGFWHDVRKSRRESEFGWTAQPSAGTVRIYGSPAWLADSYSIKLTGYGRQGSLSSDSDTCVLNAEYIVARACYHLTMGNIDKDPKYSQTATTYMNESQNARKRLRRLNKTDSQIVRSY